MDKAREPKLKQEVDSFMRDNYGYRYDKEAKLYNMPIYVDYRDCLSTSTVKEICSSPYPVDAFRDSLMEIYADTEFDYWRELKDEVKNYISACDSFDSELGDEDDEYIRNYLYTVACINLPEDHYLKQEFNVPIMVGSGDGNYDFSLNSVYPSYYGSIDEPIYDKASLVWLASQQGYTKEQLWNTLVDENASENNFLRSVEQEVANISSSMSCLTFLVRMTLEDIIRINGIIAERDKDEYFYDALNRPDCGTIVIDKNAMCGLFDAWYGGGSVFEIELQKDVELPIKFLRGAMIDGCVGCFEVDEVYGFCGSAWDSKVKEIREDAHESEPEKEVVLH